MSAKFVSPFAPLQLSRFEADQLEELACVVIGQVKDQFEDYLAQPNRQVDTARWKLVKEREDVHVYKERSPHRKRRLRQRGKSDSASTINTRAGVVPSRPDREFAFSVTSQDLFAIDPDTPYVYDGGDNDDDADATLEDSSDLPILLTVGTIKGDLYDTMYGVANPTLDMMRIKTAYIQDGMIDSAVLARLHEPTTEDPFRSLTVKWTIKGQAIHLRTLVSNRDLVYLESTGLARLPRSGELVGYQLLHSVEFAQTRRLEGCMRGNLSICGLYRQQSDGVVSVFGKGFVDPTGRIVRALVVKSATDAMLSSWRTIHTAHLKKLAYAMRRRNNEWSMFSTRTDLRRKRVAIVASGGQQPKACAICTKPLSSLATFTLGKKAHRKQCRLCMQIVCTSCRVKKELASIAPDGLLNMQAMSFCVTCVETVTSASAFDIALDELVHKDGHRGYGDVSLGSSLSPTETINERDSTDSFIRTAF